MTSVTYYFVYFSSGPHQRQPRSGPGGFTTIQSYPGPTYAGGPGETFQAVPPSPTQTVGSNTYDFSFMTVSGGSLTQGGPVVGVPSFVQSTPPPPVFVGNTPIIVMVVYVLPGGGPGSGATIDEFDLTTGALINDTFVTVAPDSTGSLTTSANVYGYVDTTNSAETITALATTSPTGVDFVEWVNLGPPATANPSSQLAVSQLQSVRALAFYQAPPANLGTINGTVSEDYEGGMFLLGGATISAQPGGVTKSNGDGTYVLTNLQPGPVQLTVAHPLTTTDHSTVTVVAGQTITEDFVLERLGTKF